MRLGVIEGWGWGKNAFPGVTETTIREFQKWPGIDIWKLAVMWDWLEPQENIFDETCFDHIKAVMDAAFIADAKVQLNIGQGSWPLWINGVDHDDGSRYTNPVINQDLAIAWSNIVTRIKDHPAIDSYLIINEEDYIPSSENYVTATNVIISAIRSIDNIHPIGIRLNTQDQTVPYNNKNQLLRTKINLSGTHDIDYGTGAYPIGANWVLPANKSPLSETSYFMMDYLLRASPLMLGKSGGVGEIGFLKGSLDTFGDEEKLRAFERALSIAYDIGFTEVIMWSENFQFADPISFFPRLKAFRDMLLTRPRLTRFNVRVLNDTTGALIQTMPAWDSTLVLDIPNEPYYHLIRFLDESGCSWVYVDSTDAELLQPNIYDTTIRLSEIQGKTFAEQNLLIVNRLQNVICAGRSKTWSLTPPEPIEQILPETTALSVSFFLALAFASGIVYAILKKRKHDRKRYSSPTIPATKS